MTDFNAIESRSSSETARELLNEIFAAVAAEMAQRGFRGIRVAIVAQVYKQLREGKEPAGFVGAPIAELLRERLGTEPIPEEF